MIQVRPGDIFYAHPAEKFINFLFFRKLHERSLNSYNVSFLTLTFVSFKWALHHSCSNWNGYTGTTLVLLYSNICNYVISNKCDIKPYCMVSFENLVYIYCLKIRKKNRFPACLVDFFLATWIFANKKIFLLGLHNQRNSYIGVR